MSKKKKHLLTVFSLVVAERLSGREEQFGYKLSQNMLYSGFLLLLNASLALDVMYQEVCGIVQNRFIFVGENQMGSRYGVTVVSLVSLLVK